MDRFFSCRLAGPVSALATAVFCAVAAAAALAQSSPAPEAPSFVRGPLLRGQPSVGGGLRVLGLVAGAPSPSFAFQWDRCGPNGADCAPISGACSARYAPVPADLGNRLVARVQLSNAAGTVVVPTPASDVIGPPGGRLSQQQRLPGSNQAAPQGTCILPPAPPPPAPVIARPVAPAPLAPPPPDPPPASVPATAAPAYMRPFPTVRIRGFSTGRGVRVTLLAVSGPPGASVRAQCAGSGCPKPEALRPLAAPARIHALERVLRAGTVLQIRVTAHGAVGKYTSFRIRAGAAPRRMDRCMIPGRWQPAPCPAG